MRKQIKLSLLSVAKVLGIFALCRWIYRDRVRVLCYHGFSFVDEHLFRPKLFMTKRTFGQRLDYLANSPYQVVSLQQALSDPQPMQVVLTMDDGWSGTYQLVKPELAKHHFPLMLYVTSYYADKQIPVLNVALSYLLWKTTASSLRLCIPQLKIDQTWQLAAQSSAILVKQVCSLIDQLDNPLDRSLVLEQLADQLDVALVVEGQHLFRLLNRQELQDLQQHQVDLQLHTHRHCSPLHSASFDRELSDNRAWLSQFQDPAQLNHFCYPSGEYDAQHLPWLRHNQIQSATTTKTGLFKHGSDILQIPRILDGEDVDILELEAELCGFMTLMRQMLRVNG